MKTIKKNSFLRIGLIFCIAVCAFLCFGWLSPKQSVASAAVSGPNVYIGDVIEAKDYKMNSANVYAEGMKIVYPSGGIYGSDKFTIEQAGRYQVTYYATVDGNRVEETKNYMAIRRPQDMIIADENMKVEYGKFFVGSCPYELTKDTYGAKVHFKAGQSITFATNLKVADLTADFNFLEMIVEPSVYGETDFDNLTVRVTDLADETNYVEYIIQTSNVVDGAGMTSYVKAGAANRLYGGYEGSRFHTSGFYGTQVFHSFRGWGRVLEDFNNKTVAETALTLALDHNSKELFIGPRTNGDFRNYLINDLDAPDKYKSDPWEGFKGDEVSVTVSAGGFSKAEGVLLIKAFGGYNFANDIIDNQAPSISFDYDMTDRLPTAEVGTRFPIIPFTVKDALDKTLKTNVWVNHIDKNGKKITVANDGESFYVDYEGTYEIIYYAEDYSGNSVEERIEITAQKKAPNIYIGIEDDLVEMDVYEVAYVPYVEDITIYGGSGTLITERAVYSPSKKLLTIKDKLVLNELGDYKVVYQATDYYGNVGYGVVTIRSQEIAAPKFVSEPEFTSVLLKGFNYDFPEVLVVETVDGVLKSLDCKTYVNGELVSDSFKVDGNEVTIRYVAEGTTGTATWEQTFNVVDAEEGKYKSKYFYSEDGLQLIDQKSELELAFNNNASATFLNALSTKEFSLALMYEVEKANFSEMYITMTDAKDTSLSVTFNFFYTQATNKWTMQLPNDSYMSAYAESKGILSFTYSAKDYKIIDTSGEAIAIVATYDDGEEFQGFSDWVYFTIGFRSVSSDASISISKICNQAMGYNKSSIDKALDEIKPIIVLDDVFLLRQKLGAKANIPTAKAFDVLGQISEFTVSLQMNGQVLASGPANQPVDYTFNKAGSYEVTYLAKDTHGNTMSLPYMILVSDETAPTLTVADSLKDTYQVGEAVTIPTYSATDNGDNCYIQVMVRLPDSEMRLLHYVKNGEVTSLLSKDHGIYDAHFKANDNAFITEKKGLYVLRVVAFDEYYNYTVKEYEFWVK